MNNENKETAVREITEYLQEIDHNTDLNIVDSSIQHYRRNE